MQENRRTNSNSSGYNFEKRIMSKNSCQWEIGNKLRFISLCLYVWSQMNGRSKIYFVARLWTRSSFRIRSIDCGRSSPNLRGIAKRDLTRVRYAGRLTVVLLMSLGFLRTYPRSLLALAHCTLTCLFRVRLSVM